MIVDGRYRVLETILDSDNRAVYLTEHQLIRRRMVVKVMHADAAATPGAVARFVSEAEAAGRLRHPNIVESTDMGFVDGRPFVVFEHLQGSHVSEEIARLGRLPVRRAVHVARQIAAALGAAHLEGIVHGALDSDHVFLIDRETDPDFVKVLGLGALADDAAGSRGSPEVMSPEQIVGADVDHRCDVWALGVMLYEMIGGRRPFSADAGAATARRRIVSTDPVALDRPDLPEDLVEVILTCLAKHPDERFQDMTELDDALAPFDVRFARGSRTTIPPLPSLARVKRPSSPQSAVVPRTPSMALLVPTPAPTRTQVVTRPGQRRSLVLALGAVAALAVGGGGLWLALDRGTDRAPATSRSLAAASDPQAAGSLAAAGATVDRAAPIEITIAADRAAARVTFRRRVTAAPMTIEATAADMVELVEVSAPGYKTLRYWITFDRPTHLHARLVAGTGLIEATEVETLVALGEATDQPAAPVAKATATPDRADRARRTPRRSIGRDAASTTPTPADAPADAPADEPAPVETDPGPREVVDVAAMQVEKVVTPTAPAPPRQVAAGFLETNRIAGNARILPDNATRQTMRHVGTSRITGTFKLCVTAAGAVSRVAMTSSSGHREYDEVIMQELRAWRFKPISIAGQSTAVCASIVIAYSQQ